MTVLPTASLLLALFMAAACGPENPVALGMSEDEVGEILGQPDRQAILVGKLLMQKSSLPPGTDASGYRLVYFYDQSGLQIWFEDGKVSGILRDGLSLNNN